MFDWKQAKAEIFEDEMSHSQVIEASPDDQKYSNDSVKFLASGAGRTRIKMNNHDSQTVWTWSSDFHGSIIISVCYTIE